MARLGARSAGSSVLAHVEALSDDLLVEEQSAFVGIELPFAQQQADVEQATVDALKRGGLEGLAGDWSAMMERAAGSAILQADDAVLMLLAKAWNLARASVEEQLLLCERTQAARLSGVALDGCAVADAARPDLMAAARGEWSQGRTAAYGALTYEIGRQIKMSRLYDKAHPERVLARLTSPDALNIPGCNGRGAFWRPVATLQRYARETAIGLVNALTETAITGTNEAAAARG